MSNKSAWSWAFGIVGGLVGLAADSAHKQASDTKNAAQANTQATNEQIAAQTAATDQSISDAKTAQDAASSQAQSAVAKRAAAASQTVYTSPLGVQTQADTAKKTLLGK